MWILCENNLKAGAAGTNGTNCCCILGARFRVDKIVHLKGIGEGGGVEIEKKEDDLLPFNAV